MVSGENSKKIITYVERSAWYYDVISGDGIYTDKYY